MKISDYVESQIKGLWGTDFDENGIPVIKTNNLTYEGNIDYSDICKRNITKEQAKEWYLKPGDLLIEKSGGTKTHSVGYVSYFEGDENKFVCNNFILALRPKNTINSKFLFYQIQFKYESNQFSDCFNKTTGIQNLIVKDYLAKEIKIYSPEKQEKIVKELDTVRSIINKNKQILKKYDTLIKSRFIEMFGENPVENGKWKVMKLNTISDVRDGTHDSPSYYSEGYPFITTKNLIDGTIDFSKASLICKEDYELFDRRSHVDNGDILMPMIGTIGGAILVKKDREFAIKNVALIKPNEENTNLNFNFLLYVLNSDFMVNHFNRFKTGGTQKFISLGFIRELPIPVPSLELQNSFAAFVQQIDKSKFAVQKSLEKAETLYKSLMQEYFG